MTTTSKRDAPSGIAPALAARRRSLYLRVHGWAALIASPFILLATLTGLLYIFTPQLEARLYTPLESVVPAGAARPLDASVAAAGAAAPPGYRVRSVTLPAGPGRALKVLMAPDGAAHAHHGAAAASSPAAGPLAVFVDPYRARVLGTQAPGTRLSERARDLHSRLLQGERWRWMIELAASWLLVMLVTGAWLWWPRAGRTGLPRRGKTGRAAWRQWHAFAGIALGLLSLAIVVTGITWSQYAGDQVRRLRDAAGQASPQAPRHLHSVPTGTAPFGWEPARRHAQALAGPALPLVLQAPAGAQGVWRASSIDPAQPRARVELVFDAYSGQVLYRSGWHQASAFGQATAVGIPFHRGEFGLWNQLLLLLFGIGVLFSLLSGWVLYVRRRRAGGPGLPALLPGAWRAASPLALVTALALCALMPLLALSGAAVLLLEALLLKGGRRAALPA